MNDSVLDAEDSAEAVIDHNKVSSLRSQISDLTARNQALEGRNSALCNMIIKLLFVEPSPDLRICKVNERATTIMKLFTPKISKKLSLQDEDNLEV